MVVRIIRLPGIHHDANAVIMAGSEDSLLIDTGSSWYQMLQVERIAGHTEGVNPLSRILLTSRRFPFSGGAKHVSLSNGDIPIYVHKDAVSSMQTGDFFTTWANRYDSDMPKTECKAIEAGDHFDLGDGNVIAISTPGHCPDGLSFLEADRGVLVSGAVLPRADTPTRWDMPGGSLLDLINSYKRIHGLALSSIVPARGPAIRGRDHIDEVLNMHLEFFEDALANDGQPPVGWPRPARPPYWLTPRAPWPLMEKEVSDAGK